MKTKSKPVSVRFGVVNAEWLRVKGGERRGRVAELVELAVTEMRQGMEAKDMDVGDLRRWVESEVKP